MIRHLLNVCAVLLGLAVSASGQTDADAPVQPPWFEMRTAHFDVYACGPSQPVADVVTRLEQFREAYGQLAGAQAVASPPVVVMVFPDVDTMQPFLPLYNGKPLNVNGFFHHGNDENLIVMALSAENTETMQIIFHEYTHLLLRRNDDVWPLWLKEGMAEIYSSFAVTGRGVSIGGPIERHLGWLTHEPLLPLGELFDVSHDSPQYNEAQHQGAFYAESWLLTHYLMLGDNPEVKTRFRQFMALLQTGQAPEQAFTNALKMPLPAMETELHRYLERGQFASLTLMLNNYLSSARPQVTRTLSPAERSFCLGNELFRIGRLDTVESYFMQARKLAPAGPLGPEGLGLLASERDQHEDALRELREAVRRGPVSFLAHFIYAQELIHRASDSEDRFTRLPKDVAAEIRGELLKSITQMPDFGPSHYLLGCVEMVQGDNLALAEKHLQRAIQLEPENKAYPRSLAEVEKFRKESEAAAR